MNLGCYANGSLPMYVVAQMSYIHTQSQSYHTAHEVLKSVNANICITVLYGKEIQHIHLSRQCDNSCQRLAVCLIGISLPL